jgi:flagellar assembly protein FliH
MKPYRPYRFPPLSQQIPVQGLSGGLAGPSQAMLTEEFQRAMDRGFREGYESGLSQGRQQGYAEGQRKGLEQGREDGRQQVQADLAHVAGPLEAALVGVQQLRDDYQAAMRRELVDLVAKVSRQVIRCELALQPRQLLTLVEETLANMPPAGDDKVEVLLNPMDLERIRDLDPQGVERWNLLADPRLDAGECRVKSGGQEADAGCRQRLDACLGQIETQLLGEDAVADAAPTMPATSPAGGTAS